MADVTSLEQYRRDWKQDRADMERIAFTARSLEAINIDIHEAQARSKPGAWEVVIYAATALFMLWSIGAIATQGYQNIRNVQIAQEGQ